MAARTDAARAEVLARRGDLLVEVQRMEASARAAVDIPAKVRKNPARTAGLAAGTAFLALGGPQRLFRRGRRLIFGAPPALPPSLLPQDVERALRSLGADGDKVRGTLEREFARYLADRSTTRRNGDFTEVATTIIGNLLKPTSARYGRQLAEDLLAPEATSFNEALAKVRARYPKAGVRAAKGPPTADAAPAPASPLKPPKPAKQPAGPRGKPPIA